MTTPGDSVGGTVPADDFVVQLRQADDRMRALAYSVLGSAQHMDDVLQDAYLKAYRAYGGFRGESSFATWLGSIVYRCCIDHGRKLSRLRRLTAADDPDDVGFGGDEWLPHEAVDAHLDVTAALRQLTPDHRAILVLVDLEGFGILEAAKLLDVPQGTVASRLSRARAALHKLLADSADTGLRAPRPGVITEELR